MERLNKIVDAVEWTFNLLASLTLASIMLIVASDVTMRYLANRPYSWSYDLISIYLVATLFYGSLSYTFRINGHISVDILQGRMPVLVRRMCQIAIGLVIAALFGTMSILFALRAIGDWTEGAVASGPIPWPTWVAEMLVTLGAGLFAIRGLVHAAANFSTMLGGKNVIPLPGVSGSMEKVGFE
jgi:TRAP-type C4-dicarboxylate transport system permease small subunit